jgi:hypothetical protein
MKVMVVGDGRLDARAALEADRGLEVLDPPSGTSPSEGSEVERIAAALRAFQDAVGGVDRLLVVGASDSALAALVVASKLRVPAAAIQGGAPVGADEGPSRVKGRLIGQLADATLADDPAAIAGWLAATHQPSRARDEPH